jgi:hypothetical protein
MDIENVKIGVQCSEKKRMHGLCFELDRLDIIKYQRVWKSDMTLETTPELT